MKFNKLDKQILMGIYKSSNGLFLYTLHYKYRISPGDLILFLEKYKKIGLLEDQDGKIKFTENGRQQVIEKKIYLFPDREKEWKQVPKEFKTQSLSINDFYIPNLKKLPKEILKDK